MIGICASESLRQYFHDIGKLFIPTSILEKPGRLTEDEFSIIKTHAAKTWNLLHQVGGMEQVALWAANHHARSWTEADAHFGRSAKELDFIDRLLACLDIYQAVRE